jgi:arylsulfatase A-like enzyme
MKSIKKTIFLFVMIISQIPLFAQQKPQNVLFILVDDMGYKDLGCYGSTFYETPNIDKLAKSGTRFTNGYSACQVCSPSRAGIMTGKYPARLKNTDWFGAPQPTNVGKHWTKNKPLLPAEYKNFLEPNETTIAEALKAKGYKTFMAGKWHLGDEEKYYPESQGFEINKGGYLKGNPGSYFSPYNNPKLSDGPVGEYLPFRLAAETNKFLENNQKQPFFVYLAYYLVHTPIQALDSLTQKYELKRKQLGLNDDFGDEGKSKVRHTQSMTKYAAMVEALDISVGRVLNKLTELGLDKNTLIIFTSDNGGLSTAEGSPTSNLPLRAGKGWMYEGGIRVPLIIRNPDMKQVPISNEIVTGVDYFPTILNDLGNNKTLDGINISNALIGNKLPKRAVYWHYPHYGNQGGQPSGAIREGDWKLIQHFESKNFELYNLKNDISEQKNEIEKQAKIATKLKIKLAKWQKEVGANFPTKNPNAGKL